MDINTKISIHNINKFEKVLLDYKKRILADFHENFVSDKVSYRELENMFLVKQEVKPIIKRTQEIDETKCMAKIYIENYGCIQCSNKKKDGDYCLKHVVNQNYGRIDE